MTSRDEIDPHVKRLAVVGLLMAVGFLSAVPIAQATSALRVRCGSVITVSTTLTSDLVCSAGSGLTLDSGVSLDLGGHRLVGSGKDGGPAITLSQDNTALVSNGTIERWSTAFVNDTASIATVTFFDSPVETSASSISGSTFVRSPLRALPNYDAPATVSVSMTRFMDSPVQGFDDNAANFTASQFINSPVSVFMARLTFFNSSFTGGTITDGGSGFIKVDRSVLTGTSVASGGECSGIEVTRSTIQNVTKGVAVDGCVQKVTGSRFIGNAIAISTSLGLGATEFDPGAQISGNLFTRNELAVTTVAGADVFNNVFTSNGMGFVADHADDNGRIFTRTVRDNVFYGNNGDGIHVVGTGSHTTLSRNLAVSNGRYGIFAPGATDGGKNIAFGNRIGQCIGVKCTTR